MTKKPQKPKISSQTGATETDSRILIKKYPNRRLYNTSTSSYIVLDDIIDLVKSGNPFVIEDTKTGEDITRTILNQIIFEQETKPANFHFPLEFQKQLIAMYGDSYGQMVPDYLTESLNLFAAERVRMNSTFESVVDRNTKAMMEYSQNLARQNMELFKRSWSMLGMTGSANQSSGEEDAAKPDDQQEAEGTNSRRESELDQIQKQIDALQDRLKSLK
ncbi:MAG: polyhydroxyalkanoate synthesis repressor PhaR [Rhizobiaceae bacterium]